MPPSAGFTVSPAQPGVELKLTNRGVPPPSELGPLEFLPSVWVGEGTEWNMIALPFDKVPPAPSGFNFRVLMNQYSEELKFTFVDDDVPNRGLLRPGTSDADQFVVTLDYQQKIAQVAAEDRPDSGGLAGAPGLPIHHEPGLWLFDKNRRAKDDHMVGDAVSEIELDVARLASIPHGNSILALGYSAIQKGMPAIPTLNAMPSGRFEDLKTVDYDFRDATQPDPYLEPYRHYIDNPFMGNVSAPGFPGFSWGRRGHRRQQLLRQYRGKPGLSLRSRLDGPRWLQPGWTPGASAPRSIAAVSR